MRIIFDMKTKMKKADIILILILLVIGAFIGLYYFMGNKAGSVVVVSVDGVERARYSLNVKGEYDIEGYDGGVNHLIIKDGYAYMSEASCPDHLCMNMGKINSENQSIVCLPNKVVVSIEGDGDTVDVIAK